MEMAYTRLSDDMHSLREECKREKTTRKSYRQRRTTDSGKRMLAGILFEEHALESDRLREVTRVLEALRQENARLVQEHEQLRRTFSCTEITQILP